MRVERVNASDWPDLLPSSEGEVFHDLDVLAALDRHFPGDLVLFGGFNGQEPVALFPAFVRTVSLARVVVSPPPSLGVPYLGPVLAPNSPKRRKRESQNRRFVREILDRLGVGSSRTVLRSISSPAYPDPRPFAWSDFRVEPRFTYRLDLASASLDEVQGRFSSSLRKEIRSARDSDMTVSVEGVEAAREIYDDIEDRYAEQGEEFPIPREFVEELTTELDDDRCRVYVARDPDGAYLSGFIALFSDDVGYYWQGGTRTEYDNVSVNSLLHWQVIEDVATDPALASVATYDLVGANTERLCTYKAQFGGELLPYYVVESDSIGMTAAKTAFRFVEKL